MACGKTIIYLFAILATLHVIWGQEASGNRPPPPHTGTKHPGPHDSEHDDEHNERASGQEASGNGPPHHPGPHPGPHDSEHDNEHNERASGQEASGNGPPHHPGPHPGPHDSEHDNEHNERASMSFPGFGGFGSLPFASMFGSGGSGASGGDGSDGLSGSQMPNPFSSFFSMFGPREAQVADPGMSQENAASEHDDSDHIEHQNRLFFSLLSSRITSCNYTAQPGARCLSCTQAINCRSNNVGIVRRCLFLHPYCNNGRCSRIPGTACTSTSSSAAVTSATEATTTT